MLQQRNLPPNIKIYEALGAVADGRVEREGMFTYQGKCASASTPGKMYLISYNPDTNVIVSDDNGSLNQGYLGYPAIAFLLKIWKLTYDARFLSRLTNIQRNAMKQQVNKNHEETLRSLLGSLFQQGYEVDELVGEVENIREQLKKLELKKT